MKYGVLVDLSDQQDVLAIATAVMRHGLFLYHTQERKEVQDKRRDIQTYTDTRVESQGFESLKSRSFNK